MHLRARVELVHSNAVAVVTEVVAEEKVEEAEEAVVKVEAEDAKAVVAEEAVAITGVEADKKVKTQYFARH